MSRDQVFERSWVPNLMVLANYFMSGKEKAAFIVAGLVETFLFLASILGFVLTLFSFSYDD